MTTVRDKVIAMLCDRPMRVDAIAKELKMPIEGLDPEALDALKAMDQASSKAKLATFDLATLDTLDALRGFAVMGILAMNIIAFALPEWAYVAPGTYGGDSAADKASWFLSFIFIDGKMRGLFSLLFGASMALIIERRDQ